MAGSLGNFLLSDMTVHWPAGVEDEDIASYTWPSDSTIAQSNDEDRKQGGLVAIPSLSASFRQHNLAGCRSEGGSSIDSMLYPAQGAPHDQLMNQKDAEHLQVGQVEEGELKKVTGSSLWYNQCQSLLDIRHDWLTWTPKVYKASQDEDVLSPVQEELQEDNLKEELRVQEDISDETLLARGTYVHPLIIPGFKYVVHNAGNKKPLFNGEALHLLSIGRGYGKRITFENKDSCVTNDNYFYSDTDSNGFHFKLVAVEAGNQFTLKDEFDEPLGYFTITDIQNQQEISQRSLPNRSLEKRVHVTVEGVLDRFNSTPTHVCLSGTVLLVKLKSSRTAAITKVIDCEIAGYSGLLTLVPGASFKDTITTVSGTDIPSTYKVKGLMPEELPVIGTFVHPNIIIGAKYKVRSLATGKYLFDGQALELKSIGRGYGKRITFASPSRIENNNYFYSDTQSEGWGFTLEAISVGDTFRIMGRNDEEEIGVAEVLRADIPQLQRISSVTTEAHVTLTVTCHLYLRDYPTCTTSVTGEALLKKTKSGVKIVGVTSLVFGGLLERLSDDCLHMVPMSA